MEILESNGPPLKWDILCHYNNEPPTCPFPRNKETVNLYKQHIKNITETMNLTMTDYLKKKLFPETNNQKIYNIVENTFPYLLEDGIIHKLIWFNPVFTNEKEFPNDLNKTKEFIGKCINENIITKTLLNKGYEYTYFENYIERDKVRSMKQINPFEN